MFKMIQFEVKPRIYTKILRGGKIVQPHNWPQDKIKNQSDVI